MQLNVNLAESSVMSEAFSVQYSMPRVCHVISGHVSAVIQGLRGDKGEAGNPGLPGFSGPKGPAVSGTFDIFRSKDYLQLIKMSSCR